MGAGSKFCVSVEGVGGDMREGQMGGALGSCSGGSIASQSRHLAPGQLGWSLALASASHLFNLERCRLGLLLICRLSLLIYIPGSFPKIPCFNLFLVIREPPVVQ